MYTRAHASKTLGVGGDGSTRVDDRFACTDDRLACTDDRFACTDDQFACIDYRLAFARCMQSTSFNYSAALKTVSFR